MPPPLPQPWALFAGRTISASSLFNTLLAPIVGSLSDTWGRKRLHTLGRLGPGCCFFSHILCQALFLRRPDDAARRRLCLVVRLLGELLFWGITNAGCWGIFAAVSQAGLLKPAATRPAAPSFRSTARAATNAW